MNRMHCIYAQMYADCHSFAVFDVFFRYRRYNEDIELILKAGPALDIGGIA